MTQPSSPTYFEPVRARLQSLGAKQVKGRELIEQLREIAADYKRALFNDNHAKPEKVHGTFEPLSHCVDHGAG